MAIRKKAGTCIVVVKEPNKAPEVVTIKPSLEEYQRLVGGYIEHVNVNEDVGMLCNKEGKIHGLSPNFRWGEDTIMGTAVFVGYTKDRSDFDSLTVQQASYIMKLFKKRA